jgi:hypothetical protein
MYGCVGRGSLGVGTDWLFDAYGLFGVARYLTNYPWQVTTVVCVGKC